VAKLKAPGARTTKIGKLNQLGGVWEMTTGQGVDNAKVLARRNKETGA
jgi:hypothetical protein